MLTWFWHRLGVVYLRELDPEWLLHLPALAPPAALGRGSADERASVLRRALAVLRREGGERSAELRECAVVLAATTLNQTTIDRIAEEIEMKPEDREALHEAALWVLAEGRAARMSAKPGAIERAEAEHQKQYELEMEAIKGRGEILRVLIEDRFGPHPVIPEVARLLADQWEADAAVHVIGRCSDLAELAALVRISLTPA